MKYPIVTYQNMLEIGKARVERKEWISNLEVDLIERVKWYGDGPEIDTEPLEECRRKIERLCSSDSQYLRSQKLDADQIEGMAAVELWTAVSNAEVPVEALDDPMFWSWVSLASLWNFMVWREPRAFTSADGSADAWNQYVDGRKSSDAVATRMYLRIAAVGGLEFAELAWAVAGGTDFWRSHILRVRVGEHPHLVRAIVRLQSDPQTRLSTPLLREFAKDLNRTLTNLVPGLLSDEQAEELIQEIWARRVE